MSHVADFHYKCAVRRAATDDAERTGAGADGEASALDDAAGVDSDESGCANDRLRLDHELEFTSCEEEDDAPAASAPPSGRAGSARATNQRARVLEDVTAFGRTAAERFNAAVLHAAPAVGAVCFFHQDQAATIECLDCSDPVAVWLCAACAEARHPTSSWHRLRRVDAGGCYEQLTQPPIEFPDLVPHMRCCSCSIATVQRTYTCISQSTLQGMSNDEL